MCDKTILIVEDDRDIRLTLKDLLESEGYRVRVADNGAEGLDSLAHDDPPCLILLDLMMPVMDGWEFLKFRNKDQRLAKVPVVVVSAAGANDLTQITTGFVVLQKPIHLDTFMHEVRAHCRPTPPAN